MIRWLRDAFGGGTNGVAADAAVGRGMADVLAALDNVIDDDAVLGCIYAGLGTSVPGADPGRGAGTVAGEVSPRIGMLESAAAAAAAAAARASGPAASRRRLALRAVAGVAAVLAAGAVALATIGAPGARHDGTGGPPITAAYVVKHVDSALSTAEPGKIAQMTVTTTGSAGLLGGSAAADEWSYGDQWRSVTYSSAGHPVYAEGLTTSSVYTLVNYPARTWARQPGLGRPAAPVPLVTGSPSCEPVVAALPWLFQPRPPGPGFSASSLPSTVASALRAAISCGTLDLAGRQRVDGTEAIELTSRPGSLISETIWVSPGTYLPVRVVVSLASGQPVFQRTADITWLRPTAENLAKLDVSIPTGFRQVSLAEAGKIVPVR
jgi:hypothetical protein